MAKTEMVKNQHIVKVGNSWVVRGEGNSRASAKFGKQADAISYARSTAKISGSEVVVHNNNGCVCLRGRKRKMAKKAVQSATILTIIDAANMTLRGRRAIADWLRRQAVALVKDGHLYSKRMIARYLYS